MLANIWIVGLNVCHSGLRLLFGEQYLQSYQKRIADLTLLKTDVYQPNIRRIKNVKKVAGIGNIQKLAMAMLFATNCLRPVIVIRF
jgi:hypothetical protein